MDIGFLGPLHIDDDVRALGPRDRVVLSALAVRPGEVLSPDQLADALWADQPPDSWPKVIQGCVVRLRKRLGAGAVETTPRGYRLVSTGLSLDTLVFERLVRRAHEQVLDGLPERAAISYREAMGLWRGRPFEELEDWDVGRHEAQRLLELRRCCEEELLAARIAAGEHRDVGADALTLVSEEPWRERRWAVLALAQYRSGQQTEALASIRRAKYALNSELGLDPGAELAELETAILNHDPALEDGLGAVRSHTCPYKGLAYYDALDRDYFYGRDAETAECLIRLETYRLLVLAGSSGSGKSSLLRAGLIPRLRDQGREVVVIVPGPDPAAALSTALASARGHPVIAVDQLEEAFTLGQDPSTIRAWLADLADYSQTRAPVVVAVRSDRATDVAVEPSFAKLLEQGLHLVGPLSGEALRAAIEGPAQAAGLRLEHGLVDLLLRDIEGEPGALPLMSHALAETWLRREGRLLTVEGYLATGGVRGAVAHSADRLYEALSPRERDTLRWTLLRLVATAPDGEPVRTRVTRASLSGDPARERVVDLLARARLVTVSDDTVELAHEALARAWPRLRSWLDDDAAGQRIWRHLSAAAEGWESLGRPPSELYRGARLDVASEWLQAAAADLTPNEALFIEASHDQAQSSRHALTQRALEQARQNRRLRQLLVAVGGLLVIALVAGFIAVDSSRDAGAERDSATLARATSLHESLANRSLALRSTNRGLAALLAVEAYRQRPDALARSALLGTFTWSPGFMGYDYVDADFLQGVTIPGTSQAVVAVDGHDLAVLDLDTGTLDDRFPAVGAKALSYSDLRVSGDGRYVAQQVAWDRGHGCGSLDAFRLHDARGCTRVYVYDISSGRLVMGPETGPFGGGDIALNRDGSLLAIAGGYDGDVAVYRTRDAHRVSLVHGLPRPAGVTVWRDTAAVRFAPDGRTLYLGSMAGPVRVIDTRTMDITRTFQAPMMSSANHVLVSRDGGIVVGGENAIVNIDVATGRTRWSVGLRNDLYEDPCPFLQIADEAGKLYCGDYFGQIEERDISDGGRTGRTLDPQLGSVGDLAVSADGRELLAFAAQSGVVSRWRLDGSGPITRLTARGRVATDGFSSGALLTSSRSRLVAGQVPDAAAVWDAERDSPVAVVPGGADPIWVGDDLVAALWQHGLDGLYDVSAHRRVHPAWFGPQVEGIWRSPDGSRVFTAEGHGANRPTRFDVRAYDTATHREVGRSVSLRAYSIRSVSSTADDRHRVVSADGLRQTVTRIYDGSSGGLEDTGLVGQVATQVSPTGVLVGASGRGELTEFALDTLQPVGTFAGARGLVSSLQFSADGASLVVTSPDQSVQVYDVGTRLRLGDAIESESPRTEGWLRPDGQALAVTVRSGVALWQLDSAHQLAAACALAGRSLSRTEWNTYLGLGTAYHRTCPG